jgi:hypothetical protein
MLIPREKRIGFNPTSEFYLPYSQTHRVYMTCSFVEVLHNPASGKTDAKSVLVAGGWELGDASEHVFRKLEVTKFEMELSRTMVTRVANWKGRREEGRKK